MTGALTGLWQVAGHLLAVLMWVDTPQRAAVLTVAVLAVALVGRFAMGASLAGATAGLPVLAITADASDQAEVRARAAGAADCLPKPVDLPVLIERLRAFQA